MEYRKVQHSWELTKAILATEPERFREVAEQIAARVHLERDLEIIRRIREAKARTS